MTTTPKISETRQPTLTRAVIRQLGGRESLEDVARHGADAGFPGFTYYTDTVAFFKRNRKEIRERIKSDADEFGQEPMELVCSFRCLECSMDDDVRESVGRCLYGGRIDEQDTLVANALAWYALEEIARELNPDL